MISCTEFIPAYSALFTFLDARGGTEAVEAFWRYLAKAFLGNLEQLVREQGLRGCYVYWSRTLREEAADFTLELDEEAKRFRILLHQCPSKKRLLDLKDFQSYPDYCRHCDVLYREVLEPLGYNVEVDLSHCDEACCSLTVTPKSF